MDTSPYPLLLLASNPISFIERDDVWRTLPCKQKMFVSSIVCPPVCRIAEINNEKKKEKLLRLELLTRGVAIKNLILQSFMFVTASLSTNF